MRDRAGFNSQRLAAELKEIFAELCGICTEQAAYRCVINMFISRIYEDTGRVMEFSLPETGPAGSVFDKLRSTACQEQVRLQHRRGKRPAWAKSTRIS